MHHRALGRRAAAAAWTITAPGKPTKAVGTITLLETGTGTSEVVELDVKVKVPLIGGKLERPSWPTQIKTGIEVEQVVGAAWLAGER